MTLSLSEYFEVNGLDPRAYDFPFPKVEHQAFSGTLPEAVVDYIAELETALGKCELVIERLNIDRQEAHRRLRMREYLEGMQR